MNGQRFRLRKVGDPEPVRAAHLHRDREHLIERDEERDLQQPWGRIRPWDSRRASCTASITSWFCSAFCGSRMPMPLYFSLMAAICGCSACIFFIDFMLVIFSGNSTKLMSDGDQDDRPAVVVNARCRSTQCTTRNSGLARNAEPAEIDDAASFGLTVVRMSMILRADEGGKQIAARSANTGAYARLFLRVSGTRHGVAKREDL